MFLFRIANCDANLFYLIDRRLALICDKYIFETTAAICTQSSLNFEHYVDFCKYLNIVDCQDELGINRFMHSLQ